MNALSFATILLSTTFASTLNPASGPTTADQPTAALNVYGPGGPLPAMKDAAATFGWEHHLQVNVVGEPPPNWLRKARQDADIIFSGSEDMMTNLEVDMRGAIDPSTIRPFYLRKAAILVRPGNPGHIKGLDDLLQPGHHILVVNGAGQQGLWEDIAAHHGRITTVAKLRANIAMVAPNSGVAREDWIKDTSLDAWLTWTIWQVSNPTLADQVSIEESSQIYRDVGVGLTRKGKTRPEAQQFLNFLQSSEGERIFYHWGWEAER
jgi:accessory colonization factor AcfC